MFGDCGDPNCPHRRRVDELEKEVQRLENLLYPERKKQMEILNLKTTIAFFNRRLADLEQSR
jgi:hypothetical protein